MNIEMPWETMKWKNYKLIRKVTSTYMHAFITGYLICLTLSIAQLYYDMPLDALDGIPEPEPTGLFLGILMGGLGGVFFSILTDELDELHTKIFRRLPIKSIKWNL